MVGVNKTNPLISCIIPTKNRPSLVKQAVQSVLDQSYQNIEIIVIDDSTDNETQKSLTSGGRIRYIRNEKSRGASYSRNVGLNEARGDVIAFLDDDDIWLPKKMEMQIELIKLFPIVSCNYIRRIRGGRQFVKRPRTVSYENMLYYNYLGSCSFLIFDKDVIRECFFDEDLRIGQDWDLVISVMKKHRIKEVGVADGYLVDFNSGSHSRISNRAESISAVLPIFEKYRMEHNDFTTHMFFLYNMVPSNGSSLLWLYRELLKARMKKKGYIFVIKTIIKRFVGRIEVY